MHGTGHHRKQMKVVKTDAYTLVRAGRELTVADPIDWVEMAVHLERNESLMYWYQPKFGTVDDQFPCVHVNGAFYYLTNKLEKAVFRNVRLTRDFSNYEMLGDGTQKLRIPLRLLREKLRASAKVGLTFVIALLRTSHPNIPHTKHVIFFYTDAYYLLVACECQVMPRHDSVARVQQHIQKCKRSAPHDTDPTQHTEHAQNTRKTRKTKESDTAVQLSMPSVMAVLSDIQKRKHKRKQLHVKKQKNAFQ